MPKLDIPVEVDLQKSFDLPKCIDLSFKPSAPMKVQLPTGGSLQAFTDLSKSIPTDCTVTFGLLIQVAPLLASMDCLLKILKLLKPLIDVVNGLPVPPVEAIIDFGKAAADLAPCLAIPTPAGTIPFVRDILCLILKVLKCFIGQLESIAAIMGGLSIQINLAQQSGNAELLSALQCAQGNAAASAANVTQAIEPIGALLALLEPLLGIAGVQPIQLPGLGSPSDVAAITNVTTTLKSVVETIEMVVDALGGCP
ncbi:MAG: hypothetical protein AB1894_02935 [Chloroflexota bacterium]